MNTEKTTDDLDLLQNPPDFSLVQGGPLFQLLVRSRLATPAFELIKDYVARRCEVPAEQIFAAARLFGGGRRGAATTGTCPEMSPHGALTEHLVRTLNTVCGRYYREGEVPPSAAPLSPPQPLRAEVVFPPRPWGEGMPKSRFRGLTQLGDEMPCNVDGRRDPHAGRGAGARADRGRWQPAARLPERRRRCAR